MLLDADGRCSPRRERRRHRQRTRRARGGLRRLVADWPKVPAIMAGMVGSRQGWREAAYVPCPATPAALAGKRPPLRDERRPADRHRPGRDAARSATRDGDVIRGEETQIVGLARPRAGVRRRRDPPRHPLEMGDGRRRRDRRFPDLSSPARCSSSCRATRSSATRWRKAAAISRRAPDFALAVRRTAEDGLPFLAAIFSVRARQLLDGVAARGQPRLSLRPGHRRRDRGGASRRPADAGRARSASSGSQSLARAYRPGLRDRSGTRREALDGDEMVIDGPRSTSPARSASCRRGARDDACDLRRPPAAHRHPPRHHAGRGRGRCWRR